MMSVMVRLSGVAWNHLMEETMQEWSTAHRNSAWGTHITYTLYITHHTLPTHYTHITPYTLHITHYLHTLYSYIETIKPNIHWTILILYRKVYIDFLNVGIAGIQILHTIFLPCLTNLASRKVGKL